MTEWWHTLLRQHQGQRPRNSGWLDGSLPIQIYGTWTMAQADFLRNNLTIIEAVAAFETDWMNFNYLARFAKENKASLHSISLWPCGVFSTTTQLAFETGKGIARNISESGKTIIQRRRIH